MPKSAIYFGFIVVTSFSLTSCGKVGGYALNPTSNSIPGLNSVEIPTTQSLKEALADVPFTCAAESCPENVGLLVIVRETKATSKKVSQCTGFLVAPHIVATNSHCLTELSPGDSCSEKLAIRFLPSTADKEEVYPCKKVLSKSDIDTKDGYDTGKGDPRDFGFFEIAATHRTPNTVERNGLPENTPIRTVHVDPLSDGLGGKMTSATCETKKHSLLLRDYFLDYSALGLAAGCDARGGNSGSPVYNSQTGGVIGILQASILEEFLAEVMEHFSPWIQDIPQKLLPHFIFTNMSCVPEPLDDQLSIPTDCNKRATGFSPKIVHSQLIQDRYQTWIQQLPAHTLYRIDPITKQKFSDERGPKKNLTYTATPFCLVADQTTNETKVVPSETSLVFDLTYRFDEWFRIEVSATPSGDPSPTSPVENKLPHCTDAELQAGHVFTRE